MPRSNTTGGSGHKKYKKVRIPEKTSTTNMIFADKYHFYAKAIKNLGGSRILVKSSDEKQRQAIIPGSMKRKIWINAGDVLCCKYNRGTDDDKNYDDTICFIEHKYSASEVRILNRLGHTSFDEPTDGLEIGEEDDTTFKTLEDDEEEDEEIVVQGSGGIKPQNFKSLLDLSGSEDSDEGGIDTL